MTLPERPLSVLIVEDEPDFRDMLVSEFSMKGHKTSAAPDGRAAFELLLDNLVDAVVTDVRMPGMDGLELIHRVKGIQVHRPAIVLITAYVGISVERAYNAGAEAIFTKPFRLASLVDAVCRVATPPAERWKSAPSVAPSHEVHARVRTLAAASSSPVFELGRGGICTAVSPPAPAPGQQLAFTIDVATEPIRHIAGSGVIRWTRSPDVWNPFPVCGVEFEYIEPECRSAVVEWLAQHVIRPYIPSLEAL